MIRVAFQIFLCFCIFASVSAQEITFNRLTKSYSNCILIDSDHFVWLGTQDGLLRYDSYDFRTFRYIQGDTNSLPNNFIWEIEQDQKDRLWIGTFGGGLAMWNRELETFEAFYCEPPSSQSLESNTIRALHNAGDTLLWVGTEEGVYGFDLLTKTFKKGILWDQLKLTEWFVYSIISDKNGVFIATENGLFCLQPEIEDFAITQIDLPSQNDQTVTDMVSHQTGFYVATENGLLISPSTKELTFRDHFAQYEQSFVRVHHIFIDRADQIWLGTEKGIAHFTKHQGYKWYRSTSKPENGLASDIIHYIAEIEPGILMAASRQGVHQFSTRPSMFKNLGQVYNNTSCSNTALGMTEDHQGNIWICSRKGFMKIEVKPNFSEWTGTCYVPENTDGMIDAYTINITQDRDESFWLAYRYNGFSKMTLQDEGMSWQTFPKTIARFNGEGINQVYQDHFGNYWIATRGFGLMQFFPDQDSVIVFGEKEGLSHPYIFRIYEDKQQKMWVATANGGLCEFDRAEKEFTCYLHDRSQASSLSSNMVLSVSEDNQDRLWVCTVDGLNVMSPDRQNIQSLSVLDGMPNDVVYAAIEDGHGYTWLSTNEGIVRISLNGEFPHMETYNLEDGLTGSEYNQHAFLKHSSGLLLFGSIDGVTVFNPEELKTSNIQPEIAITDFQLSNNPVPINPVKKKGTFSLQKSINETQNLALRHDQNFLSFQFAAINFNPSEKINYAYKMEGVDQAWIYSGERRFVSYPKLSPGNYLFRVKPILRDRSDGEYQKMIQVNIAPPPWKTWWAYTIYALLFLLLLWSLFWFQAERARAIEKAREAERDLFRKKISQDFHDEAGNKITLLSLLTDRAGRKANSPNEVTALMTELQDQIQDLRSGMRDFIWVMDPSRDTLFDAILRLRDFAYQLCEQAEIQFNEKGRSEEMRFVPMNGNTRRHFLLIFKEAVNNAVKYSDANSIIFKIKKQAPNIFIFELIDDGKGFETDQDWNGHGLINMNSRSEQIGGSLEIQSKPASGTKIILTWSP